jgi:exodeoxyribonuclease VII small subunit
MKKSDQKKSFETSLDSLEKIVRELERGDLPLEDSLKLFEEGVRLSRECQDRLNQAERRIEILMRDGDGMPVVRTFEQDGENKTGADFGVETGDDESVF